MLTILLKWPSIGRLPCDEHIYYESQKYENEIRMEVPVITFDAFSESYFMI